MVNILCVADLHGNLPPVPDCDLLLIAGDLCPAYNHAVTFQSYWLDTTFREWLNGLSCKVIGIAGNHDFVFEKRHLVPKDLPWTYLEDSGTEYKGLRIWGSAWTPYFGGWAFNLYENDLAKKWENIPTDLDILLLHGPPKGYGDLALKIDLEDDTKWQELEHVGSPSLTERIIEVKPKLCVFGHIHNGHGVYAINDTIAINASLVNNEYQPVHHLTSWSL